MFFQSNRNACVFGMSLCAGMLGFSLPAYGGDEISFPDFSDTTGLVINGDTSVVTTSDGEVLRLTPATTNQAGSVFSQAQVNVNDFSTQFSFRIANSGGAIFDGNTESGADGIVFVIQPVDSSLGGGGGGIGYIGIGTSLGVEFDTWHNSSTNDPSQSHVGIDLNGSINHTVLPVVNVSNPELDDDLQWWVWVDYDGNTLEVRLSQSEVRPQNPIISYTTDLSQVFGQETAFIGFTSATGSAYSTHDIISWQYSGFIPNQECVADINGDGVLNFFDVSAFLSSFNAGCP